MNITLLGLGEVGSLFASDLIELGATVSAYDPADVEVPFGVKFFDSPISACRNTSIIVSATAGKDAESALLQSLSALSEGALYADVSTNSAGAKKRMAALADSRGVSFADVALMSLVPGKGITVPALVSGNGSTRFSDIFSGFGMPVTYVSDKPGDAANRKLLRSVMIKGLAGVLIESMRAAELMDCSDWLWSNLCEQISEADTQLLDRLINGTPCHARRRMHEMQCVIDLLLELGVEPIMSRATKLNLETVVLEGVPKTSE